MVEISRRQCLTLPLAPLVAAVLAGIVVAFFALAPTQFLGDLVLDSGIVALVPAAEPPLGITARAALIMIGAGGAGLVAWFSLYLLIGTRSIMLSRKGASGDAVPVLRRADAHPDAPPRRPLFANSDLGTPFLDVRAPIHVVAPDPIEEAVFVPVAPLERDIPLDLDMPMSAYDAYAIPDKPADWFPPPARLAPQPRPQVFDDGERFETFQLTPMVRTPASGPVTPPPPEYDASASIHALLDRLEKRVGRTPAEAPTPREESLQESLASLRRLATTR